MSLDEESLKVICNKHQIGILDSEIERSLKVINDANTDISRFDFVDMIYWPAAYEHISKSLEKYDYIFVDECQDLNNTQHILISKLSHKTTRLIAVGDPAQCQPSGTIISMSDGTTKKIEDIIIGDKVVSYNNQKSADFIGTSERYGVLVEDVTSRKYNGNIYKIISNGKESSYTNNHICISKFNNIVNDKNICCVYLMRKGNWFRIGKTQLKYNGGFGLSYRCRTEGAEEAWILDIYETEKEALINEQYYSYKFGIPQLCFEMANTNVRDNKTIECIYEKFGNTLYDRAVECINYFNKDIDYPFYEKNKNYFSTSNSFEIYACNLFPKYMKVAHYNINFFKQKKRSRIIKANWHNIENLIIENYNGIVYSLKIEKYERYVADGILTHNCIYGFAGADTESFDNLTKIPNTKLLPLSVNYRSGYEIINLAKKFVSQIESFEDATPGVLNHSASVTEIKEGDMVLCRNTAPIVKLCLEFLHQNKKAYVKGADIGEDLIRLIIRSKAKTSVDLKKWMREELKRIISVIKQKLPYLEDDKIMEHNSYQLFDEKKTLIETIINEEKINKIDLLTKKIRQIFIDNTTGICLSTIHKAKGLENERVFIIDKSRTMPSKFAKLDWQKIQESNIQYVAITRAKDYLGFVNDWSFYG